MFHYFYSIRPWCEKSLYRIVSLCSRYILIWGVEITLHYYNTSYKPWGIEVAFQNVLFCQCSTLVCRNYSSPYSFIILTFTWFAKPWPINYMFYSKNQTYTSTMAKMVTSILNWCYLKLLYVTCVDV